jgi:hypothetical protein
MAVRRGAVPAGRRLLARFDAALKRESGATGKRLEFDEHEQVQLRLAAASADRRAQLQTAYDTELEGESRATLLVKLSAEIRLLDKAIGDHLGRVRLSAGTAKSPQHQPAVRSRWDRRNEAWAAAREGGRG